MTSLKRWCLVPSQTVVRKVPGTRLPTWNWNWVERLGFGWSRWLMENAFLSPHHYVADDSVGWSNGRCNHVADLASTSASARIRSIVSYYDVPKIPARKHVCQLSVRNYIVTLFTKHKFTIIIITHTFHVHVNTLGFWLQLRVMGPIPYPFYMCVVASLLYTCVGLLDKSIDVHTSCSHGFIHIGHFTKKGI